MKPHKARYCLNCTNIFHEKKGACPYCKEDYSISLVLFIPCDLNLDQLPITTRPSTVPFDKPLSKIFEIWPFRLYRILKATRTHVILYKSDIPVERFPDYKVVMQNDASLELSVTCDEAYYIGSFAALIRAMPVENAINPDYFKDLDGSFKAKVSSTPGSMVLFENGNMKAAIAPLKN